DDRLFSPCPCSIALFRFLSQTARLPAVAEWHQSVGEVFVGESAEAHDLPVSASRREAVEVAVVDAALEQMPPGGSDAGNATGWADVVGGYRIAEHQERPGTGDVVDPTHWGIEEGRSPDIGRLLFPGEELPRRRLELPPVLVAVEDRRVDLVVDIGVDRVPHDLFDLGVVGPEFGEEHLVPV